MNELLRFWQHLPEHINPYIVQWGSFRIGWYGLMYVVAFALAYALALYRIKREDFPYTKELVEDYLVWAALGLIAGARLGYVVFYNPAYYLAHPWEIILPVRFDGGIRFVGISGMSYHGGLAGTIVASYFFLRRRKLGFWKFSEFIIPVIPLGYTFGRLGNFINGELYGRPTDLPWGMYFPGAPGSGLRHPSQLYEAFFEGLVLFALLWSVRKRSRFDGFLLGIYIIGYATARFFIEFVREPDPQLGTVLGPLSMGQLLSISMLAAGAAVLVFRRRHVRRERDSNH
ncbi:MAG: prolipoprotein diacylglyceryl transferase [Nitrospirota bacterium]